MRFYTNAFVRGSYVYVRGHDFGKRFYDKIFYKPTLYEPSREKTKFTTIDGHPVKPKKFDSMSQCKDYIKKYEDVTGFTFYGSTLHAYTYLNERYGNDYDMEKIRIANIDIEVGSEDGFPEPEQANQPITAITIKMKNKLYVMGTNNYQNDRDDVYYINCKSEHNLVDVFLKTWKKLDPDIITGWNIRFFDIPYLVNRITKIFGDYKAEQLSPWGFIRERKIQQLQRTLQSYELYGVAQLDYIELYKKFTYSAQESYRLDHIANVEVGEKKLDYSEFANLHQLYKLDYQKFIDYNIRDVELVEKIEDKMKLIEMAMALAYDAKVNYEDVYTQVRMWDVLIHNYLLDKKMVIPQKKVKRKSEAYEGAYVKDPQVGLHKWVMSFDLNSLYPHLIMQYNISPDTLIDGSIRDISIEDVVDKNITTPKDKVLAANGQYFRKDKKGFLTEMMQSMYEDRVIYKKKMIQAQKDLQKTKSKELEKDISKYSNMQLAKKVQLNSAYGALGNQYFRFYDIRQALAITKSGQLSIKWIEARINEYLNKLLSTDNEDYVIASDTDSLYITFEKMIDKFKPKNPIEFLDKVAQTKIEPFIDKSYQELADIMNAYDQKMFMKREAIADKAIWTAKKRYMLNVYDNEGVRYTEPKLKMMGIEAIKSSTPQACRDSIKKAINLIMSEDEKTVQDYIASFKKEFSNLPFEEVAFPRSVSELNKYDSGERDKLELVKSTPIHVRGALVFNHLVRQHKLEKKYQTIKDGEKIKFCYMKEPNVMKQNVLSIINVLPKEFSIDSFVDYEMQFNKSFLEPLELILEKIGWTSEKRATLEDFFS